MKGAGLNMQVAPCFSLPDGGIGKFLEAIEQWPGLAKPAWS